MKRLSPLLLLALLSCAPAATTPPPATAPPAVVEAPPPRQFAPAGTAQRVVLLSFDGLGADALAQQTGLAAFDRVARDGGVARVIPVNPTQTIPAHVAILTGADPQRSGIVANRFHLPGTPADVETRSMNIDADVETLVEAARRQGKRVGTVPFPTMDGRTPRRSADFGLAWGEPVVRARTTSFRRDDFKREWVPPGWTPQAQRRQSFSPIMRARVEWAVPQEATIDVDLVAYDLTDDRVENYDTLYLESGGFETSPDPAGWFPISMRTSTGVHGSWSKVLRADPKLSEVRIYWGPIHRNEAWPSSFRELLDDEIGVWPGEPDESADTQTFREQLARLTDFLARAQALSIRRMPFDLLLGYQPAIDKASHAYLGTDPSVVRDAFVAADRALDTVSRLLDPARDALIVTGDHGLMVADRELRVNALLPQGWRAFTSGHVAHIYGSGDADAVVNTLTATGHFEWVGRKPADAHRNTGDIVAYAKPHIALSNSSEEPSLVQRPGRGQHGAINTHRELHTVLFVTGAGAPRGDHGEIHQTRIARFVATLLGIAPPAAAE